MSKGWYPSPRSMYDADAPYISGDIRARDAYGWLVANAGWKPRVWKVRTGKALLPLPLDRGQLTFARSFLAKAWLLPSEKVVMSVLGRLEKFGYITQETVKVGNQSGLQAIVITICNYGFNDDEEEEDGNQSGTQWADNGYSTGRQRADNGHQLEEGNKERRLEGKTEEVESISTAPGVDLSPSGFREWYTAYPRKKQPQDAERAYDKLMATGDITHSELMERTAAFVKANEGRVLPYPASLLNGRRFNDGLAGLEIQPSDGVLVGRIVSPFDDYWSVCRKKTHMEQARKAWNVAVKSMPAAELIEARRRYEESRINEEATFDINPAKWLEDKRWLDEPQQTGNVAQIRRAGSKPSFMAIAAQQIAQLQGGSS